ncbi:hypothetical protein LINPERHAP1_LOCUS28789, partial [Linum perenne]
MRTSKWESPLYLNTRRSSTCRELSAANSFHPRLKSMVSAFFVNPTVQFDPLGPVRVTVSDQLIHTHTSVNEE